MITAGVGIADDRSGTNGSIYKIHVWMNGRTTVHKFLVRAGGIPPPAAQRLLPRTALVYLSPCVAARAYGPAERVALTPVRSWTDALDAWLPIQVVLRALVSANALTRVHLDGICVDMQKIGEPEPHFFEARLCFTHMDGTEICLVANMRIGLVGEVPRLVVALFENKDYVDA